MKNPPYVLTNQINAKKISLDLSNMADVIITEDTSDSISDLSSIPSSEGCFRCDEDDHMSHECPNSNGARKTLGCFICGVEGHLSRGCPNYSDYRDGKCNVCFKCGEQGHISKDCTNPDKRSLGPDVLQSNGILGDNQIRNPHHYKDCIDSKFESKTEGKLSSEFCEIIGETNNSENGSCDMTQKQDGGESDTFTIDDGLTNPDDLLPPVARLEKYASSDIVFNRQIVARNLLETLRLVSDNQDEVAFLVTVLCNLADDYEPSVRAELMEQIPHIAAFCHKNYQLENLIEQYTVPMIIKYLSDLNNQVRKTCQASLLLMVEQGLISDVVLEEKICPLILNLTEAEEMDDHRTEAVTLMSKLAILGGQEFTQRLFLKRFCTLCLATSFQVRKICASTFGDFCQVVGKEATEKQLLRRFFSLCDDGVWGVRKACAEVFMPVSCVCSMETRHKDLAPIYMDLLCDHSRWVRMAAFQALGPFISTFAEPQKTGLYYLKDHGLIVEEEVPGSGDSMSSNVIKVSDGGDDNFDDIYSDLDKFYSNNFFDSKASWNSCDTEEVPSINSCVQSKSPSVIELDSSQSEFKEINDDKDTDQNGKISNGDLAEEEHENFSAAEEDESAFNHFQYWRLPLPDIEDLPDVEDIEEITLCSKEESQTVFRKLNKKKFRYTKEIKYRDDRLKAPNFPNKSDRPSEYFSSTYRRDLSSYIPNGKASLPLSFGDEPLLSAQNIISAHDQDIVPPELLLRYLSMTDVSRAKYVDAEIARHCAYSLPAVALTLGRKYWPCLKETYNTLASDMQGFIMQWKVRRTLASSMHQLAVILGPEITAQDLLPIFSGFLRDLDEVRIGILQHLSDFLSVLRKKERKDYLPHLIAFLSTDNDRNWRFRLIFAEQLIQICELYEAEDVKEYLVPLALALVKDKVCEVRLLAVRVMAVLMRRMRDGSNENLTKEVLSELADQFIHAPKWLHRQLYVYLCQEFIKESSLLPDQFAEDVMPHLLYLCWDRVANVRLAIARCLAMVIWPKAVYSDPNSPHCELLLQAIHTLQSDADVDVKSFANMVATHDCSCSQHNMLSEIGDPPV